MASDDLTYDACINNTWDEAECKDCCDCLDADAKTRKDCRDTCMTHDFSKNSDFIVVDALSVLGPDGDYSECVETGSEAACKECCDGSEDYACENRRFCRDACNDAFSGENPGSGNDSSGSGGSNISIEQALSDEAQMKTIAFSALAFLTGDLCSYTFFPPGKVSDFFGFQYLRDITPNGFGHNTEFAGRISDSVLPILTDAQVQALVNLANTQAEQVDAYGYKRFVMIKAFRRLLDNDLPDGATGMDKDALKEFTADLYEIDAEISYARAYVLGNIVADLTNAQKTELAELLDALNALFEKAGEGGTIASEDWPAASPVDLSGLTVNDGRVLVSTYATQLFSWYLGSVEGDTYFCPERHGTYFGSFYMKDIPPLTAREPASIDTNLTADMGTAFLNALDATQAALVTDLVDIQRTDLNNIVAKRQEIAETLRLFMDGSFVNKDEVISLVRQYGEYEGEMMYHYATNFAAVGNTLTNSQADTLMEIRLDYYERFPDYLADNNVYDCNGAWLYATEIDMPVIENTDFLFGMEDDSASVVADGAALTPLATGFLFAEGPAADADGNVFFSDILSNLIYKWSVDSMLSTFLENSGGANGLFFDGDGNLLACEGSNQRLTAIDSFGNVMVLTDTYGGSSYNEPNDLWGAPDGGVYFTDPVYFKTSLQQDGEHVYYLSPDRGTIIRVIDDMVRPNGIIGTADGATLYVTDHGAGETYQYGVNGDGTLSDKQIFAHIGADGMTIDSEGNVYLCEDGILVFDAQGNQIETINVDDQPTNASFGGTDNCTLFITSRTGLYSIAMNVSGVPPYKSNGADYTIIDTDQTNCYDNTYQISCSDMFERFSGQDSHYDGVQPAYVDNRDGTVTDLNTGLMWQQNPGDKMAYGEAVSGASTFNLAGYTDWRLPTIKELYSLIQFDGIDPSGMEGNDTSGLVPFIDTDYFDFEYGDPGLGERIIDSQWATSTQYVNTTMGGNATMFGVNFADGRIKGYPMENKTYFVIYVRGNTEYGINAFVSNGDGTISDNATRLMWMQVDSGNFGVGDEGDGALTWEQALEWAENLEFADYSDWRLPNAKELQSIVDYTRSPATTNSPAIDPIFSTSAIIDEGGDINYPFFWTSTTHANPHNGSSAVYIAFGEALGWMQNPFGEFTLMDVHGAGAQRSDPKIGDPDDYPYGHGPQGDVIRIHNYVRCVRDVTSDDGTGTDVQFVGFTTDLTGIPQVNTPMTLTVSTEESQTAYYRFYVGSDYGDPWTEVQSWSTNNSCTYTPTSEGNYVFVAHASDDPSGGIYHQAGFSFVTSGHNEAGVVVNNLSSNLTLPQTTGTLITLTAQTIGSGTIYCKFWYKDDGGWNVIKDWSTDNRATWTPNLAGTYTIVVWANTTADDSILNRPIAGFTFTVAE